MKRPNKASRSKISVLSEKVECSQDKSILLPSVLRNDLMRIIMKSEAGGWGGGGGEMGGITYWGMIPLPPSLVSVS